MVLYMFLETQGGKTSQSCLCMWIYWQLLGIVNLYMVKNAGGAQSASQMIRDIATFNIRLMLLVKVINDVSCTVFWTHIV